MRGFAPPHPLRLWWILITVCGHLGPLLAVVVTVLGGVLWIWVPTLPLLVADAHGFTDCSHHRQRECDNRDCQKDPEPATHGVIFAPRLHGPLHSPRKFNASQLRVVRPAATSPLVGTPGTPSVTGSHEDGSYLRLDFAAGPTATVRKQPVFIHSACAGGLRVTLNAAK